MFLCPDFHWCDRQVKPKLMPIYPTSLCFLQYENKSICVVIYFYKCTMYIF